MSDQAKKGFSGLIAFTEDESTALHIVDFSFEKKVFFFAIGKYAHHQKRGLNGFPVLKMDFFRV
ncbi:hypothetical protein ES703_78244 [subsurface metagenome]